MPSPSPRREGPSWAALSGRLLAVSHSARSYFFLFMPSRQTDHRPRCQWHAEQWRLGSTHSERETPRCRRPRIGGTRPVFETIVLLYDTSRSEGSIPAGMIAASAIASQGAWHVATAFKMPKCRHSTSGWGPRLRNCWPSRSSGSNTRQLSSVSDGSTQDLPSGRTFF